MNTSDIRLAVIPKLTKVGAKLGWTWDNMAEKYRREAVIGQLDIMFKKPFPEIEKTKKPLDIIFMSYLGCFQGNNIIQVTLGKILKERGHHVRFLLCDYELPICETTEIANHHNRSAICQQQLNHLKLFFSKTDFEIIWLSDLISRSEFDQLASEEKTEDWKSFEESMLLRYFKVGVLDYDNPKFKDLAAKSRHAALISAKMGKKVKEMAPDRVIMSHGTYTTRGPAREVLNNAGISLLTISRAKMAESQKFNWNTAGDWWSVDKEWALVKNQPLDKEQNELIDEYLDSRRSHSRDIVSYNLAEEESKESIIKKLNLDPTKKTYTLFTNLLWDAASAQREIAFKNPIDWTISTIKWFVDQPDKQLVVRTHPAESIFGTKQPMIKMIKDEVPNLTKNIVLLEPDAKVNSWSILKITDMGLVHTSTVGLELALEGIPCVCLSKTHYRGKGFTVDVDSRETYFKLLDQGYPDNFDKNEIKAFAKRYAYLLFLRYQLPMPFYNPKSHISIHSFKEMNWDKIINYPTVPLILDSIENKKEFLMPNKLAYKIFKQ